MKQDKEYYKKYYQDHKKEMLKNSREWQRNNPEKVRKIKRRYREKDPGGRKESINKTDYGGKSLKELYIKRYGKDLGKTKDDVTHTKHKTRMVCVDCILYKTKGCPSWDNCEYKEEILELINGKKENIRT